MKTTTHSIRLAANMLADTVAPTYPSGLIVAIGDKSSYGSMLCVVEGITFQNTLKDVAHISCYISTDHSLYSKCTCPAVNGYICTSGSGVVGENGAAATV